MTIVIAPSPILELEEGIKFLEQIAMEENIKEPDWRPSSKLSAVSKKILERSNSDKK